jgi:hypothetical protein
MTAKALRATDVVAPDQTDDLKFLRECFRAAPSGTLPKQGAIPPGESLARIARWMTLTPKRLPEIQDQHRLSDSYSKAAIACAKAAEALDEVIAMETMRRFKAELSTLRAHLRAWPFGKAGPGRPPQLWQEVVLGLKPLIDKAAQAAPGRISKTGKFTVMAQILLRIGVSNVPDPASMQRRMPED